MFIPGADGRVAHNKFGTLQLLVWFCAKRKVVATEGSGKLSSGIFITMRSSCGDGAQLLP